MNRIWLVILGGFALFTAVPGGAGRQRTAAMKVNCTVIGRIALTYRALGEGGIVSSPAGVSRPVPDAQMVRYVVESAAQGASIAVSIRGMTNLESKSYRLVATLVDANTADEWQMDGVRLTLGQATPVGAVFAYGVDQRHEVRVRVKNPEKTNAGVVRFQVLPN
jgi:hypothetical protein